MRKCSIKNLFGIIPFVLLLGIFALPIQAQDTDKSYEEIERIQDKIEHVYLEVNKFIDTYPDVTYSYVYEDGDVTEVIIDNVPDHRDKRMLEVYLIDLDNLRNEIMNLKNRVGVYYVTETEPRPKAGKEAFYEELQSNLTYPESATEMGVEGTIFVKFVVDYMGNVENTIASEDLESPAEYIVDDMKEAAIAAVKATSGDWKPAEIGGVPVSQWMVLPVQFDLESKYFTPAF